MNSREHWSALYETQQPTEVGWFQDVPGRSLALIRRVAPDTTSRIIDVGGGASTLVDHLLRLGYCEITVLDIAGAALRHARTRLGAWSERVTWIEADILTATLPRAAFDLWHDRAVFHFLTTTAERARYVARLRTALRPGGHVVLAAFALDGPERCSGLPVQRHNPDSLAAALGVAFHPVDTVTETHYTPSGKAQAYQYAVFRHAEASANP